MPTGNSYPFKLLVPSLYRTCICCNYWDHFSKLAVIFQTFDLEFPSVLLDFDFCLNKITDISLVRQCYAFRYGSIFIYFRNEIVDVQVRALKY